MVELVIFGRLCFKSYPCTLNRSDLMNFSRLSSHEGIFIFMDEEIFAVLSTEYTGRFAFNDKSALEMGFMLQLFEIRLYFFASA